MFSAVLLEANRRHGLRTSGVQFFFWTMLLICGIPMLRSQIHQRKLRQHVPNSYAEYDFWSYFIFYIVSLGVWFLNCYADRDPMQTKFQESQNPYPEDRASFLSRLSFTWFDSIAWTGYRRPLEKADLWDINPKDSSKEIRPLFAQYWNDAVAEASRKNV